MAIQRETDSNYGEVFTVWDWLLGTISRRTGAISRFGLGESYDPDAGRVLAQLRLPRAPT